MTEKEPGVVFIRGHKVNLCVLTEEHARHSVHWINDQDTIQHILAYLPTTPDGQLKWYQQVRERSDDVTLAVETHDGHYIGNMGVHGINHREQFAHTGALIGRAEYQGKGYGTDAKMHLLHWAFTTLNLRVITSSVLASNGRSQRYLEKTGYRVVGRWRKRRLVKGVFVDEILLEVFREEFMPLWDAYCEKHAT